MRAIVEGNVDLVRDIQFVKTWISDCIEDTELFEERLLHTESTTNMMYVLFPMLDGRTTYGRLEYGKYISAQNEDKLEVESVFSETYTATKESLKRPRNDILFVCIHMAFLSRDAGM